MSFTQKQPCLGLRLVIPAELLRAVNLFYDLYDEPEIITVSTVYSVTPCQGGRESVFIPCASQSCPPQGHLHVPSPPGRPDFLNFMLL